MVGETIFSWRNLERLHGDGFELNDVNRYRYLQVVGTGPFVSNSVFVTYTSKT